MYKTRRDKDALGVAELGGSRRLIVAVEAGHSGSGNVS